MNIIEACNAAQKGYLSPLDITNLKKPNRRQFFHAIAGGLDNLYQQSQGTPTLEVHSPQDRNVVDQEAWQYIQHYKQILNELTNGREVSSTWEEDRILAQQIVPNDHVITANMASPVFNNNIELIKNPNDPRSLQGAYYKQLLQPDSCFMYGTPRYTDETSPFSSVRVITYLKSPGAGIDAAYRIKIFNQEGKEQYHAVGYVPQTMTVWNIQVMHFLWDKNMNGAGSNDMTVKVESIDGSLFPYVDAFMTASRPAKRHDLYIANVVKGEAAGR